MRELIRTSWRGRACVWMYLHDSGLRNCHCSVFFFYSSIDYLHTPDRIHACVRVYFTLGLRIDNKCSNSGISSSTVSCTRFGADVKLGLKKILMYYFLLLTFRLPQKNLWKYANFFKLPSFPIEFDLPKLYGGNFKPAFPKVKVKINVLATHM